MHYLISLSSCLTQNVSIRIITLFIPKIYFVNEWKIYSVGEWYQ